MDQFWSGTRKTSPTHRSPSLATNEHVVGEEPEQEWDICLEERLWASVGSWTEMKRHVNLDTTNAEFDKGSKHLAAGNFICGTADRNLHKQAVVMRLRVKCS